MALMTAQIVFSPALPTGANVTVTGNTFTEVKTNLAADLQAKLTAAQSGATTVQNALNAVNS